jgi:hypothetical protein
MSGRWDLTSRRMPVLRFDPNRTAEIKRHKALLPSVLRRDPTFAIGSPSWDTFVSWEWYAELQVGYLCDQD